jgi:hypothetical protein
VTGIVRTIWTQLSGSGILIPTGTAAAGSMSTTITFLGIKEKALALDQMYRDNDVVLPPGCNLAKHIADAVRISDLWLLARQSEITASATYHAAQLDRIANAFVGVRDVEARKRYLRALTSGSLEVFERTPSFAKDILWEMELCALLKARSFVAELREPDIVVTIGESEIGVPCKKIYSEANIERTLSDAVSQIEREFELGIVAFNLDDLQPANQVRVTNSEEALRKSLSADNFQFLGRHQRHFRRYLSSNRILGALAASGGFAVINEVIHTTRQYTIWAFPTLPSEKMQLLHKLQDGLMPR